MYRCIQQNKLFLIYCQIVCLIHVPHYEQFFLIPFREKYKECLDQIILYYKIIALSTFNNIFPYNIIYISPLVSTHLRYNVVLFFTSNSGLFFKIYHDIYVQKRKRASRDIFIQKRTCVEVHSVFLNDLLSTPFNTPTLSLLRYTFDLFSLFRRCHYVHHQVSNPDELFSLKRFSINNHNYIVSRTICDRHFTVT